jgi:putative transposase
MPYRSVEFCAGQHYHFYNRGNNFLPVFFERENYLYFLRQARQYLATQALNIVAYCLMPTHYHLLVYLRVDDPSRPMQKLALSYTKAVNKRFARIGALFQGRFKAVHVDRDEYLLHLSRYIHLNPVMAGLVQHAQDWEFSSYPEYVGMRAGTLPRPGAVLSLFPSANAYRAFVESYAEGDGRIVEHLMLE